MDIWIYLVSLMMVDDETCLITTFQVVKFCLCMSSIKAEYQLTLHRVLLYYVIVPLFHCGMLQVHKCMCLIVCLVKCWTRRKTICATGIGD